MKLWKVIYGLGNLLTMAETKEEAIQKFLKSEPSLAEPITKHLSMSNKDLTWKPIETVAEVTDEVEYFGE